MPVYVYECPSGHRFEKVLKVKHYNDPQTCECGNQATRKTVPTMLSPDIAPWDSYVSPATGNFITSHKQRKQDMKASGCVDYEPSLRKTIEKQQRDDEIKFEKSIDETVEREYEKLPSQKKEMLERELTAGADLQYTRGIVNE